MERFFCNDPGYRLCWLQQDNILIVANSVTEEEALELGIRDGCASGTVLIVNGNAVDIDHTGYNPRTAIGQAPTEP